MKTEDFNAAMAIYASADQRATASLIELLTATVMRKLAPPQRTEDVVTVSVTPFEIEETLRTHHFEARYVGDEMTVFLTPLAVPRDFAPAD